MTRSTTLLLMSVVAWVIACDPARPVSVEKVPISTPVPQTSSHDGHPEVNAPRISLADAKKDFDAKTAVFIDTHAKQQYDAEHISGAINIPGNQLNEYFDKIPKGKKLIVYCS